MYACKQNCHSISYHIRIKISIIAPFLFVDCTLESIHRCGSFAGYLSVDQVTAGEERVSGEKYYIGERKILNNRKVVDGELAHLCLLYTIVVENFSGMVGGYLCVDQTTGEERVSASRTGAKC